MGPCDPPARRSNTLRPLGRITTRRPHAEALPAGQGRAGQEEIGMLPLQARVLLAHARIASLAETHGLHVLHVKGYAAVHGVYAPGRTSTDVDVLTTEAEAPRLIRVLQEQGWEVITDFSHGSIFGHAATLRHRQLGYADVHRFFPGLGLDPAQTFETLWRQRTRRIRAGHSLPVPSLDHQRLLVLVHASRDPVRRMSDVTALRQLCTDEEWARLRETARQFHAEAAWQAATGENIGGDPAQVALYLGMGAGVSELELFLLQWRATPRLAARFALLGRTLPVNRAHLSMSLGRAATTADALRWQWRRLCQIGRWGYRRVRSSCFARPGQCVGRSHREGTK